MLASKTRFWDGAELGWEDSSRLFSVYDPDFIGSELDSGVLEEPW